MQPGQSLLTLANPELFEGIAQLKGQEKVAEVKYYATKQQSHYDDAAEADLESQLAAWHAVKNELDQRSKDVQRLDVRAPIGGRVISASYVTPRPEDDGQIEEWHGHPLEKRNRGAF